MLPSDTLALGIRAEDDFGIQSIGYAWGSSEDTPQAVWEKQSRVLVEGSPEKVELGEDFIFAPGTLDLPPGSWQVWAYARDYRPNVPPSFSAHKTIQVLTSEEHASLLRAEFRQMQEQLEQVARQESMLLQETQGLAAEQKPEAEAIRDLETQERANAKNLDGLPTQAQALL